MKFPYLLVNRKKYEAIFSEIALLKSEIKLASDFIGKIEKGNLTTETDALGNSDLGAALIGMQQRLIKIAREEQQRNWATEGLAKFVDILRSNDKDLHLLAEAIIASLVRYVNANQGALFVARGDNNEVYLEMLSCYAYDRKKHLQKRIIPGEGLVGQCYLEAETIVLTEVPQNYVSITSGLGQALPTALVIVPLKINDTIFGIIELASFKVFEKYQIEFLEKLGESIASTISSAETNIKTKKLLEESQEQSEMMRAQEEEMRQNMEELTATQEEMIRKQGELEAVQAETERQKNSTESLMNNIPGVVYRCKYDAQWSMEFISNKSALFTGYKPEEFTSGTIHLGDLIHPEDQQRITDEVTKGIEQKKHFECRYRMKHKNGTERWVWDAGSAMLHEDGSIAHIEGLILDITEQVKADEENRKMAQEALHTNQLLKAQEEEMRINMEQLMEAQEALTKKSLEIENVSRLEKERAETQITSQKKIMESVVAKFKMQEQQMKERIAELERQLAEKMAS